MSSSPQCHALQCRHGFVKVKTLKIFLIPIAPSFELKFLGWFALKYFYTLYFLLYNAQIVQFNKIIKCRPLPESCHARFQSPEFITVTILSSILWLNSLGNLPIIASCRQQQCSALMTAMRR
jgi:hypothetical protein